MHFSNNCMYAPYTVSKVRLLLGVIFSVSICTRQHSSKICAEKKHLWQLIDRCILLFTLCLVETIVKSESAHEDIIWIIVDKIRDLWENSNNLQFVWGNSHSVFSILVRNILWPAVEIALFSKGSVTSNEMIHIKSIHFLAWIFMTNQQLLSLWFLKLTLAMKGIPLCERPYKIGL